MNISEEKNATCDDEYIKLPIGNIKKNDLERKLGGKIIILIILITLLMIMILKGNTVISHTIQALNIA